MHADPRLVQMAWVLFLIVLVVALVKYAFGADLRLAQQHHRGSAGASACREARPADARAYWSYRLVDNRPCWYEGRPGKPKDELFWPRPHLPTRPREEPILDLPRPAAAPPMQQPPVGRFEQTWRDLWLDLTAPPELLDPRPMWR